MSGSARDDDPVDSASARADALYRRGLAENSAGRPLRARRLLERAAAELDGAESAPGSAAEHSEPEQALRRRIALAVATAESELNGLDSGLRALTSVADYVERTGDDGTGVLLQLHLGYMKVRGGNFTDGLAHLDSAVELLEHADPRSGCNILLNRGMVHVYLGELSLARADYQLAVRQAQGAGLLVEEVKARHNLGEVEFYAGNLALALKLMDEAAGLDAEVSPAVALVDRAKVLIEAGLHREADEALLRAGIQFRSERLWKDVGEVELARAECALLDGEINAARRLAGSARTRFRRRANDRWRRDAELVLLQADLAAGRPGAKLVPPALRLAEEFRRDGLATRSRTAQLIAAEALLRADRVSQAHAVATEAGAIRPSDPISARLHTRLVRSKLQLAAGRRADARREIRTGRAELIRYRARFGSIDLQTSSAVHGRQLAELDLSLALGDGNPAAVLSAAEQWRAISNRLRPVVAPADPVVARLLAELRQAAEELRQLESDSTAAARAARLRHRMGEVQQLLRARSWQAEGNGEVTEPAGSEEIVAGLQRCDAAFVCYLESGGTLSALTLDRSGRSAVIPLAAAATVHELVRRIRADLDVLANERLPQAIAGAVRTSLGRALGRLEDALVRPLGLAVGRMVIAPTGTLGTVPWNLLPSLTSVPVVVTASASTWLQAIAPAPSGRPTSVAAFAGPDLAQSPQEVLAVADCWPGAAVHLGALASRETLRTAIAADTVVHVAAHGRHQPENPLFSSIRLADGPVFAYEFDGSAAEHVVLSACELGQATIRPGDETLGLTSVLLHLGTRSVVSGVARVHDDVAGLVMARYHRLLAAGVDSSSALAESTAAAAAGDRPAPFVCFGSSWRPAGQPSVEGG